MPLRGAGSYKAGQQSLEGEPYNAEDSVCLTHSQLLPTTGPLLMLFLLPGSRSPPPRLASAYMSLYLTTLSNVRAPGGSLYFCTLFLFFTALTTNCIYFICLITGIYSLPTQKYAFHGAGSTSVLISDPLCLVPQPRPGTR